ncbi:hypothetical protein ACVWYF_003461 [Hymenobacter sp. UYAg731]
MTAFRQYQSFISADAAQPLIELLFKHGMLFETGYDKPSYDPKMAFNETENRFVVRLKPTDFEAARTLEDEASEALVADADPDHYLFGFTDEELLEVVMKRDEWSSFDVALAGRILRQRGRDVTPDTVRLLRQYRAVELTQPEASQKGTIMAGYALALLGGIVGIIIGLNLLYAKKKLLDGTQGPAYSEADRAHGFRIIVLGFVVALVAFVVRVKLVG